MCIRDRIPDKEATPMLTKSKTTATIIGMGKQRTNGWKPMAKSILAKSVLIKEVILPTENMYLDLELKPKDFINNALVRIDLD